MRWCIRILLIIVACLIVPAGAQAATPFTAGSGAAPTVAVGSDGVGHVVWETDVDDNNQVGYCRVSPGGSACNRTEILDFPGNALRGSHKAQVFTPAPSKVVIVAGCWQCGAGVQDLTYRWISNNNGTSFGAPVAIGSGPETSGHGTWLEESSIYVGTSASHVKAAISNAEEGVDFASGGIFSFGPEVARVPGTTELVAVVNDLDEVKYGVYHKGLPLSAVNINNLLNWEVDKTLPSPEPDNSDTALNSGPNGVFLTYRYFVALDTRVGLRRYDPATNSFGGPVYLEGPDTIENNSLEEPDSFQDPSGRIHVLWSTDFDNGRLRYTVSDTGGGAFTTPATLAKSEGFYEPEIAAGGDGKGFATWTPGLTGAIRVVPLDPQPESGASADTTPPGISGFDIGDTTLFPGQGTKFTFRSTEAGQAVLTVEKRFKGVKGKRKGKKVCLPASKKRLRALRKKGKVRRCTGYKRIGEIRQRVKAGLNTIVFSGRIAGRKLTPGQYRAKLVITDAAGLVSRTETLKFKVVGKKKKTKRGQR